MDIAELADLEEDFTPHGARYRGDDFASVGASYTDMVNVREIADAVSVSEGSIMSIIDWDQVDQLIADVH